MKLNTAILSFIFCILSLGYPSCTKEIDIEIPDSAQQVVVDGTIENGVPPIVILSKSQKFFSSVNLNDLGSYFVHGAAIKVSASDGTQTDLIELCLQDLALPDDQKELLLNALGFSNVDSANLPNVCVYTVPDIVNYFLSGTCSFMGKERTSYALDIVSPPLYGSDSVHLTSSTYIPTAIGMDSLGIRSVTNPSYADSMVSMYAYVTVPDTFGNFLRYKTKRNNEPFYSPQGAGSVYDDRLFVGLKIGIPMERGQNPSEDFDFETAAYFWKGDTVTVKWSNIDAVTYEFFYTLENDGGDSPFSSPIKIKTNINNGLGIWAGYASKYYTVIIPE
ncbi:MAG: DUF4249 family protein [Bacteroidota bacterium]